MECTVMRGSNGCEAEARLLRLMSGDDLALPQGSTA